jgi:hypothetical protein
VIDRFTRKNVLGAFTKQCWPDGDSPWGQRKTAFRLKARYEDFLAGRTDTDTEEEEEDEDQCFVADYRVTREEQMSVAAKKIATGVVHDVPSDMCETLLSDAVALAAWEDLTALARNEWICWVEDAKKDATRRKRMNRLRGDLRTGKRRPCCWPGCRHRMKQGR